MKLQLRQDVENQIQLQLHHLCLINYNFNYNYVIGPSSGWYIVIILLSINNGADYAPCIQR